MTSLMIIMAILSGFLVAIVFGMRRSVTQETFAIDKKFITAVIIISVVIGAIISGIDTLIEMLTYH